MTTSGRHDPEQVAVIRDYLADHLRAEARTRTNGTSAPLKQAAEQPASLPLDNPLLCALTAQATRWRNDLDDFYFGPGWSHCISRFDPRTTCLRSLLGAIYEWNHDDEIDELDELGGDAA